jgi:DNA adenine methylase
MLPVQQFALFDAPKTQTNTAKPFLKWAGGKTQLIPQITKFLPQKLIAGEITSYAEPFIGGGALFLHIAQNYPVRNFYISDTSEELIILYLTIQRNVIDLIEKLTDIERNYCLLTDEEQKEYFYKIRKKYNKKTEKVNLSKPSKEWIDKAGNIIFLNRTCFNGLFRVNSKGGFNVPFGSYKNPRICDEINLLAVSNILDHTEIKFGDFTRCESFVDEKTFVYFDPPYRPLSKTASFNSYSKVSFNDDEQARLSKFFRKLHNKGAHLMLSNSDPKNIDKNDNFFDKLYDNFTINYVSAKRMINSKAEKRGSINEILITNY